MRYLLIYSLFLFSFSALAEEDFKLHSTEDKVKAVETPMGAVNEQGAIEWNYPPGYWDKKQAELEEKKKAELAKEKARLKALADQKVARSIQSLEKEAKTQAPEFTPAKNKGRFLKGTMHLLGYYYGGNASAMWRQGNWSYGVTGKFAVMNNPDTEIKYNLFGALATGQYHFYPRWYTDSSFHKVLDPYAVASVGYLSADNNQGGGLATTVGLGAAYPLSNGFKVYGEYEILMFKNPDNISGSYSVGVSWEY